VSSVPAVRRGCVVVSLDEYQRTLDASRLRQRANLRAAHRPDAESLPSPGETLAALAARYGVSERLLRDAYTIRTLAPDQLAAVAAGDIPVHRLANRLHQHHRNQTLKTPPLPRGRFDVILADPPWQLGNSDSDFSAEQHYPTLPIADITGIHVPAAQDAILFLWAISGLLSEALEVVSRWRFTYKTSMVWVKHAIGPGAWLRNRHELLLTAIGGNWSAPPPELRRDSVITAKRRRHSQKPDEAYERIESMYPTARRLELFARTAACLVGEPVGDGGGVVADVAAEAEVGEAALAGGFAHPRFGQVEVRRRSVMPPSLGLGGSWFPHEVQPGRGRGDRHAASARRGDVRRRIGDALGRETGRLWI
jgi:N6-adenosine-specific RNA methylase IME4